MKKMTMTMHTDSLTREKTREKQAGSPVRITGNDDYIP